MFHDSQRREGRRGLRYGIDAPYVPALLGSVGVVCVVLGAVTSAPWLIVVGAVFLLQTVVYMHTTLRGKFHVWEKLLDQLDLRGDEEVLDLGCGRGAVLTAVAARLPRGRAHGIDLWRSSDQSGNDESTTLRNARDEGVDDRVELHTGDMRSLPFPDNSLDMIVSSLAIHNLRNLEARNEVLDEAMRVLRSGGRVVIADIRSVRHYAQHLRHTGAADVNARSLGPGGWFAGPWQATSVVSAVKP